MNVIPAQCNFDGLVWNASTILEKATSLCSEFQEANLLKPLSRELLNPPVVLVWRPPSSTAIKLNLNGAISKANGKVWIGVVACDSIRQIIGLLSSPIIGFLSPRVTKAKTLVFHEALVFSANNGLKHIIEGGDALHPGPRQGLETNVQIGALSFLII